LLHIDGEQISIAIDLDQGARLASLQWRDMEFVIPFRGNDYNWGWFSMVPFAGRIKNGIIRDSSGNKIQLPTIIDPPNALIGLGASASWEDIGNGSQYLELPSPFNGTSVIQRFEILDDAIRWSLRYEPSECDLPVTLGFHPWIPRDIGKGKLAQLNFKSNKMFKRGDDLIPTGDLIDPHPQPWDDTFTQIVGIPEIIWPGVAGMRFEFDSPFVMIYTHDDEAICVEPVTAPPDAQNLGLIGENDIEMLITFRNLY